MKLIAAYNNGNYNVAIYDDGTKIRDNGNDSRVFTPEFPESIDLKITNYCDKGCKFCHETSSREGVHGDIVHLEFFDSLRPYTELAIGGGNPLSHPRLEEFLIKCKEHKLIPSMTVNQRHFMDNIPKIKHLVDEKLIYGLGISLTDPNEEGFINQVQQFPNAVVHVIAGLVDLNDLYRLGNKGIKLLILGYKIFRRGEALYEKMGEQIRSNIEKLKDNLLGILSLFDVVSFDNLAVEQLRIKNILSETQYNEFFMGEDGEYTMYIDAVKREFAVSSTSVTRYPITNDIVEMFHKVQSKEELE